MREGAEAKGRRYLTEGRLTVERVGDVIEATCRGNGESYRLGHDGHAWWCSCPALSRRCAHLLALQLVTDLGGRRGRAA